MQQSSGGTDEVLRQVALRLSPKGRVFYVSIGIAWIQWLTTVPRCNSLVTNELSGNSSKTCMGLPTTKPL